MDIMSLTDLTGSPTPTPAQAPAPLSELLINRINSRLAHAYENGASCIVIGPRDGFTVYGRKWRQARLAEQLFKILIELHAGGYTFVKSTTPEGDQALRVYFKAPPTAHRIEIDELHRMAAAWGTT